MPRASSAAASDWYTLFLALDGLAAEEKLRPELVPLLALVERDGGIDDLVRELVERRVDREARRHPVHALEKLLAGARQQKFGKEERRVRPSRVLRHADRARLAEGGRERLPVDRGAGFLQRLHVVVVGVDEKRDVARGDKLRAEDVPVAHAPPHRCEAPEEREPLLLAHALDQRGEPEDVGRLDREAPVPARLQKVLVRRRQLGGLHEPRVVAEDEEREARRNPLAMVPGKGRRRELGEHRRIEILEQLLATQCLHAMRAGLEDIGAVVRRACLGERPLHDLLRRAAPVDELYAVLLLEGGGERAAVLHGHRAVEDDLAFLLRTAEQALGAIGPLVHIDIAIGRHQRRRVQQGEEREHAKHRRIIARAYMRSWHALLALCVSAAAQAQPATLRVMGFAGSANAPVFVAQDKGFFAARALQVDLAPAPDSATQIAALREGRIDIALTAMDNVLPYPDELFAFLGMNDGGRISLMVAPRIRRYAELKGEPLAVDALASGYAFVLMEMLARNGLAPGDYRLVSVGGSPERLRAPQAGQAAGPLRNAPTAPAGQRAGLTRPRA